MAVDGDGGPLSYAELDAAANRLARALRRRGAGPGRPVGVLLGRSPAMIAAVLGVMKAASAYLPLDPAHPPERWRALLDDAGAALVVVDAARYAQARTLPAEAVLMDDTLDEDSTALEPGASAEDPAYLIYTSGTTGLPKGVCVEHRHLVAYCDAVWACMGLAAGDRFATVSSLAADLGNTMIFPPLAHGGCVVVVREDLVTDAAGLSAYFARHPVDCLKIVPSHLRALLDGPELLPRKLLVLGGEACDGDLVAAVRALAPGRRILNHYGPTETTVGVLTFEVPDPWPGGPLPLGLPLAGAKVMVLDRDGRPLPAGIEGEIHIGGATVARGYWNRPELTAERFRPDPARPGGRVYRTGDRARRLDDGTVIFLGRIDRQVKLRGYRVEPGEVEAALAVHPAVAQAVVQADSRGQLFAHVVATAPVDGEALARFLRASLPAHMIPAAFVFVEAVPLTSNGKIDYAALPTPVAGPARIAATVPRDSIEMDLALIWQSVLAVERIGVTDDFFDAGGHSLLAVQLMARINRRFGRALPLACLFEHGTIAGLAELLRAGPETEYRPLVTIQPQGAGGGLVFVHPAGGNVLCYYDLARALGPARPFRGLQARFGDGDTSVAAMARRYFDAMPPEPPEILGGWSMGALVAFEMARLYAKERGASPAVAVLDQMAPGAGGSTGDGDDDLSRMVSFARKVSELVGGDIGLDRALLQGLGPKEQAAAFLDRFKRHDLAPATTTGAEFRRYLDLMLAHNRVTADYRPAVHGGRVVVFRADTALGFDGAVATERPADLGWGRWCGGRLEVVAVPGNHVSMMRPPNVQVLANRLSESMT